MVRLGLKQNNDCKFCTEEDECPKHMKSNCTAITKISANHFDKDIIDEGEPITAVAAY